MNTGLRSASNIPAIANKVSNIDKPVKGAFWKFRVRRFERVNVVSYKPRQPATQLSLTLDVAVVETLAQLAGAAASIAVVARVSRA